MAFAWASKHSSDYTALPHDEVEEEGFIRAPRRRPRSIWSLTWCLRGGIAVLLLVSAFVAGGHFTSRWRNDDPWLSAPVSEAPPGCRNATVRLEWRSLSQEQKLDYLQAARCLTQLESQIVPGQSAHDDFAWVHSRFGEYSHGQAAFLTWHRYFIHIYEQTLRERCGFQGNLPYWDWSLDWEDIPRAPVWDPSVGFGGDGNTSDVASVSDGHCVTDGFFAGMEVANFGEEKQPHCLSRGFVLDAAKVRGYGQFVSPDVLEPLLRDDTYLTFNLGLEMSAHNAIPVIVRGDFYKFTAPNDPLFFLHHAQLDRVLWRWHQRSPARRRPGAYGERPVTTKDKYGSERAPAAAVTDLLSLGPLAPTIQVADIWATESDLLCYRY